MYDGYFLFWLSILYFDFRISVDVSRLQAKATFPGPVFTNHSQEHSLSLSPRFANLNVTQLLIG